VGQTSTGLAGSQGFQVSRFLLNDTRPRSLGEDEQLEVPCKTGHVCNCVAGKTRIATARGAESPVGNFHEPARNSPSQYSPPPVSGLCLLVVAHTAYHCNEARYFVFLFWSLPKRHLQEIRVAEAGFLLSKVKRESKRHYIVKYVNLLRACSRMWLLDYRCTDLKGHRQQCSHLCHRHYCLSSKDPLQTRTGVSYQRGWVQAFTPHVESGGSHMIYCKWSQDRVFQLLIIKHACWNLLLPNV
jgi:hypothetical protein